MLERASRSHIVIGLVSVTFLLGAFLAFFRTTQAVEPGTPQFQRTWERTDKPVKDGQIARTWMWGPEAFTDVMDEPYAESPGGMRQVQYFDKSRMEINFPDAPDDGLWYVTNGLLVVEMITGQMQVGENSFEARGTSLVNVAGDPNDPTGPTYSSFISHLDRSPDRTGQTLTQRIARDGTVSDDAGLASQGVTSGYYDDVTGHNVANVFWEFMNSQGLVYEDGQYIQDQLFINPFYATGRPITEPYFADVQVLGAVQTVLMQCFERRCMTYTPTNNTGFQVEAGNVGLHYFCWRYGYLPEGKGECIGSPVTPPPGDNGGDNGGNGTSTPGGGDNGGPTPTSDDTDPTATSPSGDAPGVDVDLNLGTIQISALGGGYNVPVYVANTGTQTDTIEVTLTKDAAISLCGPDSQSESITLNGGQSTILNFSQSCGILSVDLAVEYTATATIARSPGASDTDSDDLLLVLNIGGGDDPTATSPSGNAPGVDVSLNLGSVELGVLGGNFNVPVRVTNTGSQTDTIQVSLSRTAILSLCTLTDTSKSVTLAGGASTTVTFQESCGPLAGVQLLPTYTATGTINRSPGATDSDSDQLIINITLLPGGGDDDPTPPSGNNPGVDVDLNLSAINVNSSLLSGTTDPFSVPVQVTNTGTQSDSIRVSLSGSATLGTCSPSPTSKTVTVAAGTTTTVTFTQSCSGLLNLVGTQLLVTYTATGTIDRAPGASDSDTATQILNLSLLGGGGGDGGGDNPPPGGNANVDITSVPNTSSISLKVGQAVNLPITIKNNGDSAASGQVNLSFTGLSTCSPSGSIGYSNLAPGASTTVTFSRQCLVALSALTTYTAQVTVGGTVTDTETFSVTLNVSLLSNPVDGMSREAA